MNLYLTTQVIQLLAILFLLTACTEEIEINLNDADPQIVVEGNISPESSTIQITKSINYDVENQFPAISNANVRVSDSNGNSEKLEEISAGIYKSAMLGSLPGVEYFLSIDVEDESFYSACITPQKVPFQKLLVERDIESNFFGEEKDSIFKVSVEFIDSEGVNNYYHFVEFINGEKQKSYFISDKNRDGLSIKRTLNNRDRQLMPGDVISIEMQCVDEKIYDYLNNLGTSRIQSSTPYNPENNIDGIDLGFFSAYTSEVKSFIVPEF